MAAALRACLALIVAVLMIGCSGLPVIYSFSNLERKYGGDRTDWLGRIFFSFIVSPKFVQRAFEIGKACRIGPRGTLN
jgi:hypothetical protein